MKSMGKKIKSSSRSGKEVASGKKKNQENNIKYANDFFHCNILSLSNFRQEVFNCNDRSQNYL